MTTVIVVFFIALIASLAATPLAGRLGILIGAVDKPSGRKVHHLPTPRSGGIAILAAFSIAVCLGGFLKSGVFDLFVKDPKNIGFFVGAIVLFVLGFADDIFHLSHRTKFLFQVLAASAAFFGGVRINAYYFTGVLTHSAPISYCLTVFWFLLLVNAINLIDGLDGLAGGIVFFTCTILAVLLGLKSLYLQAALFAALGGTVLGFLRYNFEPASVFLGDGGSYFLGYMVAGLAIICSAKAEATTLVLVPLIAMGVPVFDTVLAPVRRFLIGRKLFQADRDHIHHKLLEMGFSKRKAVFVIYGASIALCLLSISVSNLRDREAGLFLIIASASAFVFAHKLGYLQYLALDKIGWFRDLIDATGLSRSRRSFLALQIDISRSRTIEDLWKNVCAALDFLNFDRADFRAASSAFKTGNLETGTITCYNGDERRNGAGHRAAENVGVTTYRTSPGQGGDDQTFNWSRGYYRRKEDVQKESIFKVELPLAKDGLPEIATTLCLFKDVKKGGLDAFTLRRVEQLRRTLTRTLGRIDQSRKACSSLTVQELD